MPDILITPPIRTPLTSSDGDGGQQERSALTRTTRDWWLYWSRLGDQANSNAKLVTQGSHAQRPDAGGMPDGAIYVESDRGSIYQVRNGVWRYVAGTMWGTITPDQRPTDLGLNDGGFDYRCTDVAREFMWSQTAWVEVTAVIYGIHSGRPNPSTIVDGSLYVEHDRGSATYQEQAGAWKYVFGTMYGTLTPDQRPTDLGANDVGFDFRTSVAPPREFLWSGSAWAEITPVGGYLNLTHPNVVTRVDTTSGQIVEGGITDESAANSARLHIDAAGNVAIANALQVSGTVQVSGTLTAGSSMTIANTLQINGQVTFAYVVGAASDAAAAAAGVPLYGLYHNAGALRFRIT